MGELPPDSDTDATARRILPRGRVFLLGLLGLAGGMVVAALTSGDAVVRWVLVPLAMASVGLVVGFLSSLRALRRSLAEMPQPVKRVEPQPHQLPRPRPAPKDLALGPNPWEGSLPDHPGRGEEVAAVLVPSGETEGAMSDADTVASPAPIHPTHDGARLLRPSDHELELARRAVARIVADMAPQPGAFDAVCERLLAAGVSMAQDLGAIGRDTTDFEKVFGIDLFDRLVETRITEAGLGVMQWVRWVFAALHEDNARDDDEFFAPVAIAMASRYGGKSERWQSAIAEPLRYVELGGVVEQIALGVKATDRSHDALPDPDAVDRILETPQWM